MIYTTDKDAKTHVGIEISRSRVYWALAALVGSGLLILAHVCAIIVYVAVVLWK